jgi:hypothetical protein
MHWPVRACKERATAQAGNSGKKKKEEASAGRKRERRRERKGRKKRVWGKNGFEQNELEERNKMDWNKI